MGNIALDNPEYLAKLKAQVAERPLTNLQREQAESLNSVSRASTADMNALVEKRRNTAADTNENPKVETTAVSGEYNGDDDEEASVNTPVTDRIFKRAIDNQK